MIMADVFRGKHSALSLKVVPIYLIHGGGHLPGRPACPAGRSRLT
jgi:hypothetical protein